MEGAEEEPHPQGQDQSEERMEEEEEVSEENDENASPVHRVNPFEKFLLRSLSGSMISPTIFKEGNGGDLAGSPVTSGGGGHDPRDRERRPLLTLSPDLLPFRRDLESSPSSHTNPYPTGEEEEAKAQEDILSFFSQGKIAPTPDDVVRQKTYFFGGLLGGQGQGQGQSKVGVMTSSASSWTNTTLSLPPTLPTEVEELLSQYFTVSLCSETEKKKKGEESSGDEDEGTAPLPVRRRLNLSFGEYDSPFSGSPRRVDGGDPFCDNHMIATPPTTRGDEGQGGRGQGHEPPFFLTPATDLEARFRRCEFTPDSSTPSTNSSGGFPGGMKTPNLTPIRSGSEGVTQRFGSSGGNGHSSPLQTIPPKRRKRELNQDFQDWDN